MKTSIRILAFALLAASVPGCDTAASDGPEVGGAVIGGGTGAVGGGADAVMGGSLDGYVSGAGDTNVGPPDVSLGTQPLAGVCALDSDCQSGACNDAYPGGYCTIWCSGDSDCPDAAKCYQDPETKKKMCWKACQGDWECIGSQFCPPGANICTPKCVPGSCGAGYKCYTDTGQCVPVGTVTCSPTDEVCDGVDNDCDSRTDEDAGCAPPLSESDVIFVEELGSVKVGGGGLSLPLLFEGLTTGSAATILLVDPSGLPDLTAIYSMTGPDGTTLISASEPFDSPIRAYPDIGAISVQIPNTPSVDYLPGGYSFSIYRDSDTEVTIWAYVLHTLRTDPEFSKMDVNYWFVGTPGLTASTAPTKNKFQSLHQTFKQVMNGHGVNLGQVNYYDISGSNASKYTYVNTGSEGFEVDEHAELLAMSAALPTTNRGVNFFFVQGFNGWGLLGKAGGIPGPPLLHGTWHSGVAVSLVDYYDYEPNIGIPVTAETMAHELGHQLGLFHTSEQNGQVHDPIPDTYECTADWNGDEVVDLQECQNFGANNLMFWSVSLSAKLTPGQKHVIHRNASMY